MENNQKSENLASNAITILNFCHQFRFEKQDFSYCKIPNAILSNNKYEKVNF